MAESIAFLRSAFAERYDIEEELGRGGAAIVYRAVDRQHHRAVAIKVMRPEYAISSERFLREIEILARLQHPHIVPLFDSGRADHTPFFVMPLVDGESLRVRLNQQSPLPVDDAIDIALEIADALAYAHRSGLVHRDVKPENILLSAGHALLSDFGIARAIEQSIDARTTGAGVVLGTPAYMSPEQALGDTEFDQRSDQYSLACVVYEMLAGQSPLAGGGARSEIMRAAMADLPEVRLARPDVPKRVSAALTRALSRVPENRFDSIEEFARALGGDAFVVRRVSGATRLVHLTHDVPWYRTAVIRWSIAALVVIAAASFAQRAIANRVTPASARAFDPQRIAVLYFDDHSADRSLGHLASGLTESLIHELSLVHPIRVVSRNGVKPFRNVAITTDSIATVLQVGSIVEGSVQRSGERVRVRFRLINTRNGDVLASADFARELGELFLLEDDLARAVSADLRRQIGVEVRLRERVSGTRSVAARELVWRADRLRDEADTLAAGRELEGLQRAVHLGRIADSLLASAERADPQWLVPVVDRGWLALETAGRQARAARDSGYAVSLRHAERALARVPESASALELRGTLLYNQAEQGTLDRETTALYLARASHDLERAIAHDSSLASAWGTLSRVRRASGDVADAERNAVRALAMDAYLKDGPSILQALASATLMNDSLAASWNWCTRGAREYPTDARFVQCQLTLLAEDMSRAPDTASAARLLAQVHRLDPPERARARGRPWLPIYRDMAYAVVLARAGARDSARAVLARARATVGADEVMRVDLLYEEALLALVMGERKRAMALLSEYLIARPVLAGLVARHPRWRALRADPAFRALVRTTSSAS